MISVAEARRIVVDGITTLPVEQVDLFAASGRVLAADVIARVTQPAAAVSSMDGYAVRSHDVGEPPTSLRLIGTAAAGRSYAGRVAAGETVRILTGAPLPDGADAIIIQEQTRREGERIIVLAPPVSGRWIRPAAMDFAAGAVLTPAGHRLSPRDIALAAAANVSRFTVRQRPRVAIIATGDELVMPGERRAPTDVVNSNGILIALLLAEMGATAVDLGIVGDDRHRLTDAFTTAAHADLVLTIGGASVGERDLVRPVLAAMGFRSGFEGVAMRPGKPAAFGWLNDTPVLVMPGNPVSAAITLLRLAKPIIDSQLDCSSGGPFSESNARLTNDLPANDEREDHLRTRLRTDADGTLCAESFDRQDSALLTGLAAADGLILRPPHAPAAHAGDTVSIIRL